MKIITIFINATNTSTARYIVKNIFSLFCRSSINMYYLYFIKQTETMKKIELTKEQMCKMYGCTMSQLNDQLKLNAEGLDKMAKKANKTGKNVNGFTEKQLIDYTEKYKKLSEC